jgi:hypothetical protein
MTNKPIFSVNLNVKLRNKLNAIPSRVYSVSKVTNMSLGRPRCVPKSALARTKYVNSYSRARRNTMPSIYVLLQRLCLLCACRKQTELGHQGQGIQRTFRERAMRTATLLLLHPRRRKTLRAAHHLRGSKRQRPRRRQAPNRCRQVSHQQENRRGAQGGGSGGAKMPTGLRHPADTLSHRENCKGKSQILI